MGTLNLAESKKVSNSHREMYGSSADVLFNNTQQKLLTHIFVHPERSFYARELISLTKGGTGAVQRELSRFANSGLLTVTNIGNQKHYKANSQASIFSELRSIIIKTFGVGEQIKEALYPIRDKISLAFIYGSMAKGDIHAKSDIDVMVISDTLALSDLFVALNPLEPQLNRQINPTLYTSSEFLDRRKNNNSFLSKVLAGKLIPLIGELNAH